MDLIVIIKKLIRDLNVKNQGQKYNFEKVQGYFYKNTGIRLFSDIFIIIFLKEKI
jgi:hypothetical protein